MIKMEWMKKSMLLCKYDDEDQRCFVVVFCHRRCCLWRISTELKTPNSIRKSVKCHWQYLQFVELLARGSLLLSSQPLFVSGCLVGLLGHCGWSTEISLDPQTNRKLLCSVDQFMGFSWLFLSCPQLNCCLVRFWTELQRMSHWIWKSDKQEEDSL